VVRSVIASATAGKWVMDSGRRWGGRCEGVLLGILLGGIDPSCDAVLGGHVAFVGLGRVVVLCHG